MDTKELNAILTDLKAAYPVLSGLGVHDVRFVSATINGKRGLNCLIFAGDELFDHLAAATFGQYSERLVLILRAIIDSLKTQAQALNMGYAASEAVALTLKGEQACRTAGVGYVGDYFIVPDTNMLTERNRLLADGQELNSQTLANVDAWGRLLMQTPFFDDRWHSTWMSFSVCRILAPTQQSDSDLLMSLAQVQYGWNYCKYSQSDPMEDVRHLRMLLMQCMGTRAR